MGQSTGISLTERLAHSLGAAGGCVAIGVLNLYYRYILLLLEAPLQS